MKYLLISLSAIFLLGSSALIAVEIARDGDLTANYTQGDGGSTPGSTESAIDLRVNYGTDNR
jgi:hypothetical protein